jgi:hypothetical protein
MYVGYVKNERRLSKNYFTTNKQTFMFNLISSCLCTFIRNHLLSNLTSIFLCRKPGTTESPFDILTRSSLYTWFTPKGQLKPKYIPHVHRHSLFFQSSSQTGPLTDKPELVEELCDLLLQIRDNGQSLNAGIIQPIF